MGGADPPASTIARERVLPAAFSSLAYCTSRIEFLHTKPTSRMSAIWLYRLSVDR
jgi:hypothetical protein